MGRRKIPCSLDKIPCSIHKIPCSVEQEFAYKRQMLLAFWDPESPSEPFFEKFPAGREFEVETGSTTTGSAATQSHRSRSFLEADE
jgi:hypothetical protein